MSSKPEYLTFIGHANQYGLPTRFLSDVASSSYTIVASFRAVTFPTLNIMSLPFDDWSDLTTLSLDAFADHEPALQDVYHESVHAWLDINADREDVSKLARASAKHYSRTLLKDGSKADKPEEIFQEAMAEYVGVHVTSYWIALGLLRYWENEIVRPHLDLANAERSIHRIREGYESTMRRQRYGYERPHFYSDQMETVVPISHAMSSFCDHELMEDHIHHDFASNPRLYAMWSRLFTRIGRPGW